MRLGRPLLNGPDLDKGPSDLSVNHIFQINGLVEFPWQIQVSSILRVQSGFHFSRTAAVTGPAFPAALGTTK